MPRIERVTARRLWDGAGRPALEAEVWLRSGAVGRAVAVPPVRRLGGGALELRDGGPAFAGGGVTAAVTAVREDIAAALGGHDARDQAAVDRILVAADGTSAKGRLGANALLAVSLAVARAVAALAGEPLWRRLGGGDEPRHMPLPIVEVLAPGPRPLQRGASSAGLASVGVVATGAESLAMALDWSAEVVRVAGEALLRLGGGLGVAPGGGYLSPFEEPAQALDIVARAIERAGFSPGEDIALAVDVGAGGFGSGGRYVMPGSGEALDGPRMVEMLIGWLARHPVAVLEDPLAPDGGAAWPALTRAAGAATVIVGGDLLASDSRRVVMAADAGACNAVRIEPQRAGTLTEAKAALDAGRAAGWRVLLAGGAGGACDTGAAELAVGWGAELIRVGGLMGAAGTANVNELIRIAGRSPRGGRLPERGW